MNTEIRFTVLLALFAVGLLLIVLSLTPMANASIVGPRQCMEDEALVIVIAEWTGSRFSSGPLAGNVTCVTIDDYHWANSGQFVGNQR